MLIIIVWHYIAISGLYRNYMTPLVDRINRKKLVNLNRTVMQAYKDWLSYDNALNLIIIVGKYLIKPDPFIGLGALQL